jgi:hypothetical protein
MHRFAPEVPGIRPHALDGHINLAATQLVRINKDYVKLNYFHI